MAEVLVEFPDVVVDDNGAQYHAHACGSEMPDGMWQGWLEFMPVDGGSPIRSSRETTQPNRKDTVYWATGLTPVYRSGALQRALHPVVIHRAAPAEPFFGGPAPTHRAEVNEGPAQEAVLDPFAAYEKGEGFLRTQLTALSSWHLVNIINVYRLSAEPWAVLSRMPADALIELIVSAVAPSARAASGTSRPR
jgi:hypothetical protein